MVYGRDGDDYVIVASQGGAPKHPSIALASHRFAAVAWFGVDRPDAQADARLQGDLARLRAAIAAGNFSEPNIVPILNVVENCFEDISIILAELLTERERSASSPSVSAGTE